MWNDESQGGTTNAVAGAQARSKEVRLVTQAFNASDMIGFAYESLESRAPALTRLRRIIAGSISLPGYVRLLHQLHPLQLLLERALRAVDQRGGLFCYQQTCRADIIARDLVSLDVADEGPMLPATSELLTKLTDLFDASPCSVMGSIFTLEAARLGSVTLARALSRALGLPIRTGKGLDYLLDGMGSSQARFNALRADIDAWCDDLGVHSEVVAGARLTAEGLCLILCEATDRDAAAAA